MWHCWSCQRAKPSTTSQFHNAPPRAVLNHWTSVLIPSALHELGAWRLGCDMVSMSFQKPEENWRAVDWNIICSYKNCGMASHLGIDHDGILTKLKHQSNRHHEIHEPPVVPQQQSQQSCSYHLSSWPQHHAIRISWRPNSPSTTAAVLAALNSIAGFPHSSSLSKQVDETQRNMTKQTQAMHFSTFKTLGPFLVAAMRPSAAPVDSNASSTKRSSEAASAWLDGSSWCWILFEWFKSISASLVHPF